MLNIVVCIKQVFDPEAPVSSFRIDPEAKRVLPPQGSPPVINPDDECALEAALRIRDAQSAKVTVISMGSHLARPVLQKSLAVGADELVLLEDNAFEDADGYTTAYTLANAIRKIGEYDLILCGRMASDTGAGQVGCGIAEILGISCVTVAQKVEVVDGKTKVERVLPEGYQVIEASMPTLVTVGSGLGNLRFPPVKAVMEARKKKPTVWNVLDLGIDLSQLKRVNLVELSIPHREVECQIVGGESAVKAGENLALKLREAGII